MKPIPADSTAPTAERTLRFIELLLSRPEGWTPQELLLELDLSRSALFVLLRSLKALGYVEQSGKRGRYIPGSRLNAWRTPHAPSTQDLVTAFYQETEPGSWPQPEQQAQRETVALVVPASQAAGEYGWMILAQVEGSSQVRSAFSPGQVLSELPAAAQVITRVPSADTAVNGYALVTSAETIELALPICRDGRTPEAALLLSAPTFRWTEKRLLELFVGSLREKAAHLSYRLGAAYYAPYQGGAPEDLRATRSLSGSEITAFLHGPYAASLACIRPDGRPHVIPVWQEWDGHDFYVIAWKDAQWGDYLLNNPRVSLTVDEPWSPLRRVVVQGCAQAVTVGQAEIEQLLQRMSRRYLGHPAAPGLLRQVLRAYRIRPDTLRGWQGLPVHAAEAPSPHSVEKA